jgi:hypothetical protein
MATAKISCKLGEGSKTLIPLPDLAAPGLKISLPQQSNNNNSTKHFNAAPAEARRHSRNTQTFASCWFR